MAIGIVGIPGARFSPIDRSPKPGQGRLSALLWSSASTVSRHAGHLGKQVHRGGQWTATCILRQEVCELAIVGVAGHSRRESTSRGQPDGDRGRYGRDCSRIFCGNGQLGPQLSIVGAVVYPRVWPRPIKQFSVLSEWIASDRDGVWFGLRLGRRRYVSVSAPD